MKCNLLFIFIFVQCIYFISAAGLVGFRYDSYSNAALFGTVDPATGNSTTLIKLTGFRESNSDQHAYNTQNKFITVIATDGDTDSPYFLTLDSQKGTILNKATAPYGPVPFALTYDSGILYAQIFSPAQETSAFVTLNPTNGSVLSAFTWPHTDTLYYISTAFNSNNKYYYTSYLVMNATDIKYQSIATVDVIKKAVVSEASLKITDLSNPVTNLQYNPTTNRLYGFLTNTTTNAVDLVLVSPTTGIVSFLNVFTNITYSNDIRSVALNPQQNVLYAIFIVNEIPHLITVDLARQRVIGDFIMKGYALIDMLTYTP